MKLDYINDTLGNKILVGDKITTHFVVDDVSVYVVDYMFETTAGVGTFMKYIITTCGQQITVDNVFLYGKSDYRDFLEYKDLHGEYEKWRKQMGKLEK